MTIQAFQALPPSDQWRAIEMFLERTHKMRRHLVVGHLADILKELKVSPPSIYRRKQSGWRDPEELRALFAGLETTPSELMEVAASTAPQPDRLEVAEMRLKRPGFAQVILGAEFGPDDPREGLVAVRVGDRLLGYYCDGATKLPNGPCYPIEALKMLPLTGTVVVLEDDAGSREALADKLRGRGLQVDAYASLAELRDRPSDEAHRPQAYVIDFYLGRQTAQPLIESIRQSDPFVPIWLISGQALENHRDTVHRLCRDHGLTWEQKPFDMDLVAGNIAGVLRERASRSQPG